MNSTATLLRIGAPALATLIVGPSAVWGAFALWYQIPAPRVFKTLGTLIWTLFSAAVIAALWQGRMGALLLFALAFAVMLLWWIRIAPSDEGQWADDVARITTGTVDGDHVTLHDVRNFDWHSRTDYVQRWETRSYDLAGLRSVDMIMSHWRFRKIAHMLMSFGFDDGSHIVFSVEVRRCKYQEFSEIGGFFKEFPLSIIASDERDVVRVRTNVRGEEDYLYQLRLPPSAIRLLFLGYVDEANALAATPRFYHTVTMNCTVLVYQMMKRIVGHLPLDYRLLLSGYLPEYVYELGGLDQSLSLEELRARGRITDRAKLSDRSPTFSTDIRRGLLT